MARHIGQDDVLVLISREVHLILLACDHAVKACRQHDRRDGVFAELLSRWQRVASGGARSVVEDLAISDQQLLRVALAPEERHLIHGALVSTVVHIMDTADASTTQGSVDLEMAAEMLDLARRLEAQQ